jgi:helicase
VAEIVHPGLDLRDRVGRLTMRLTYGVPSSAVDIAREVGSALLRGDYCALANAALCDATTIEDAPDAALLACLGNDLEKVTIVREAAEAMKSRRRAQSITTSPVLEPYVA